MPNWCSNYITITSDSVENLKPIYDFVNGDDRKVLLMKGLVPLDELDIDIPQGGLVSISGIYGTKWDIPLDACDFSVIDKDLIIFSISTAWSPPIGFCDLLSKKYKVNVNITYFESGADIAGNFEFKSGVLVSSEELSYYEGLYKWDTESFYYWFEENCRDEYEEVNAGRGNKYPFGMFLDEHYPYLNKRTRDAYIKEFYDQNIQ